MVRNINDGGGQGPDAQVPPGPQLPEPSAPTTLTGPLGVRWKALGGMGWGRPAFKPVKVPGGQFVTFTLADNSANVTMYASAAGTFVVTERIDTAWRRLGQHDGTLGFLISEELSSHHGGRYQHFGNGMIVWHASTGAFAVRARSWPSTPPGRLRLGVSDHRRVADEGGLVQPLPQRRHGY